MTGAYPLGMAVDTVIFDVGETLVHARPSFPGLFAEAVREVGHDVADEDVHRHFGVIPALFASSAEAGDLWTTSDEDSRRFWSDAYARVLEPLGVEPEEHLIDHLYATFTDVRNYVLFDDVEPTLQALNDAGLRLGIVSNFEAWLEDLLQHLDLVRWFPVRIISGLVGLEKPDHRIFGLALEELDVEPDRAAYVGDNPLFDAEPASTMGMLGIVIDRHERHPRTRHTRITDLRHLPEVLGA